MKTYICKLYNAAGSYHLYEGTTLISDSDLATLKGANGEAYFVFDFDSITPSDTGSFVIRNSNGEAVFSKNGLGTGFVKEGVNYDGAWTGDGSSGVVFDTFVQLKGKTLDEAQLSFLMGKIKEAGGGGGTITLTTADYNWPTNNPTYIAGWLLEPGYYQIGENLNFAFTSQRQKAFRTGDIIIKTTPANENTNAVFPKYLFSHRNGESQSDAGRIGYFYLDTWDWDSQLLINAQNVVNSLGSTDTRVPLSANQGRALNEKIESSIINGGTTAPTTSTVGAVGTLYSYVDTTGTTPEPHLMVCTEVNSGTYTWTDLLGSVTQILHQINNGSN